MIEKPTYEELEQRVKEFEKETENRKQAEESFAFERAQLFSIFDNIVDGVYVSDIDTHELLYMNPASKDAFQKELVGGVCYKELQGLDSPCEFCTNEIILKQKPTPHRWEYHNPILDKDYAIVDRIITWQDGRDVRLEIALDITDRKRAEGALQHEKEFSDEIIKSLPGIFYMYDEKRLVRWNKEFEIVSGYTSDELGSMYGPDFFEGADRVYIADRMQVVFREGASTAEAELVTKEGRRIPYHFTGLHWMFEGTSYLIGLGIDITDRRRAEAELRYLRNYLSNIIDSMPSVLVGVDADGKVTQWNKKAEQITGIATGAAQGKTLSDVFPHMASEMKKIAESIRTREAKQEQKRLRLSENGTCYEDVTIYPLVANGVEGAVIRIDDVTDKVRMEEMMIQREKMLSVGGLAVGMAHEINNPLAGILQNVQVMKNRMSGELTKNMEVAEECGISIETIEAYMKKRGMFRMIESVMESGKRAAKIVNNMLSFSRKSDESFAPHSPCNLLDKTVELAGNDYDLKQKCDFRQIEIVERYDKATPQVTCEGSEIQQVILNILKNGAQAMAENKDKEEPPRFILRVMQERDMARIEIADNGPGMDEATRKRVFEPFYTTKPVGTGTGLGMSVSYFIITENHGGTMEVESSPGKGAKFIIRMPFERNIL